MNINFHRVPGYCVNPPLESRSIWTDQSALDDAAWMWEQFAARYKGISNREVSFDLINEPSDMPVEQYVTVAKCLIAAIRAGRFGSIDRCRRLEVGHRAGQTTCNRRRGAEHARILADADQSLSRELDQWFG